MAASRPVWKKKAIFALALRIAPLEFTGGNRVSLSLTLLQSGGRIFLSAITSGGSQAVFWKINIFGEEAFLDTIRETVENYII